MSSLETSHESMMCSTSGTVKDAQLVMIEQPTRNEMDSQWTLNVLKESACDTNVDITSIRVGGSITGTTYDVIVATGFYTQRLTAFYTDSNLEYWTNLNDVSIFTQSANFSLNILCGTIIWSVNSPLGMVRSAYGHASQALKSGM